ncbi:MAG: permease [Paeniclostridium sordellii]|nr:permease [Paeniclostridium sordellii]
MTTILLYTTCLLLLAISYFKNKSKTKAAILKGLKSFENIMPQFLAIVLIISLILSILSPEKISSYIGPNSNIFGVFIASIVGSITTMPTFVAFSTGDLLLKCGAGYAQVAAFISTSTMVGILTFKLEAKFLGKKCALYRNIFAFLFSFIVAIIIGGIFN